MGKRGAVEIGVFRRQDDTLDELVGLAREPLDLDQVPDDNPYWRFDYDESQHPRDEHGRWTDADGGESTKEDQTETGDKLSDRFDLSGVDESNRPEVTEAFGTLDKVFPGRIDGPPVKVVTEPTPYGGEGTLGTYNHVENVLHLYPAEAYFNDATVRETVWHETGHWIDREDLTGGNPVTTGTRLAAINAGTAAAPMSEVMNAISNSVTGGKLEAAADEGDEFSQYATEPTEEFARAFAQYVATKANDTTVMNEYAKDASTAQYQMQWRTDDFKPISDAIDKVAKARGWK